MKTKINILNKWFAMIFTNTKNISWNYQSLQFAFSYYYFTYTLNDAYKLEFYIKNYININQRFLQMNSKVKYFINRIFVRNGKN